MQTKKWSQEIRRRLRLRRVTEKIVKCKDVSMGTKTKIIHSSVFLITMPGCESWIVKKADKRKKMIYLKYGVRGELCE